MTADGKDPKSILVNQLVNEMVVFDIVHKTRCTSCNIDDNACNIQRRCVFKLEDLGDTRACFGASNAAKGTIAISQRQEVVVLSVRLMMVEFYSEVAPHKKCGWVTKRSVLIVIDVGRVVKWSFGGIEVHKN